MSIEIYFNLHKKVFSIRNKGKVVEHATAVTVTYPKFIVQPAGRAKVLRDKVKNVHAFVSCDTGDAVYQAEIAYLTIDNDNKPCINICRLPNETDLGNSEIN